MGKICICNDHLYKYSTKSLTDTGSTSEDVKFFIFFNN